MFKNFLFFFLFLNSCSGEQIDLGLDEKFAFILDPNFEQLLIDQGIDTDLVLNGRVLKADIIDVIYLPLSNANIYDLSGIENFLNLKKLDCFDNKLTSLDVSQNKALKELNCRYNQLTSLDVSQNTNLTSLLLTGNEITSIDVSKNLALSTLGCSMNRLTSLDLRLNSGLKQLYCSDNRITNLDISQNKELVELFIWNNQLTSLDVSKNTNLTELYCYENQLTKLDLTKNTALTTLSCGNNELVNLNLKNGNNLLISALNTLGNIDLKCIQVDDEDLIKKGQSPFNNWITNSLVSYSKDCNYAI